MASKSDASTELEVVEKDSIEKKDVDEILSRMKSFLEIVDTFNHILSHCPERNGARSISTVNSSSSSKSEACNILHIVLHEKKVELQAELSWRFPALQDRFCSNWKRIWSSSLETSKLHYSDHKSADPDIWKNRVVDVTWNV